MLFPQRQQVETAVAELLSMGLRTRQLHTVAREGIDLKGLPEATVRQRSDFATTVEHWLWNANLALFAIALLTVCTAIVTGQWAMLLTGLVVMAVCFFAGNYFTSHVPHVHMQDYRNAIDNGEILLLVDVPAWRVNTVESRIRKTHPEMELGGIGWSAEVLGI